MILSTDSSVAPCRCRARGGTGAGDFLSQSCERFVRYEPRALFRTYLYAIAVRQLTAERRKATFRDSWSKPLTSDPGVNDGVEEGLAVREALAQLDADDREVLLLREYEELSYAEIAGLQRVPVNTVRSRLFRARQALKELLMN